MLITDIKQQVNDKNRVSVYIDGKFAFGMTETDRLFLKLEVGKEITKEKYDEITEENLYSKAKDKAAKFLGYRMRSAKELKSKLREDFSEDIADRVVELFKGYGYINDLEFAAAYAKDCFNIKKWGRVRIKNELRQKGISNEDINAALDCAENKEETYSTIKALLDRRIKNTPIDLKEKQKHFAFLMRRGFDIEDIKTALEEYC